MPFPYDWPIVWDHEDSISAIPIASSNCDKNSLFSKIKNILVMFETNRARLVNLNLTKISIAVLVSNTSYNGFFSRLENISIQIRNRIEKSISQIVRAAVVMTGNNCKLMNIDRLLTTENIFSAVAFLGFAKDVKLQISKLVNDSRIFNGNRIVNNAFGYFENYIERIFKHGGLFEYLREINISIDFRPIESRTLNVGRVFTVYQSILKNLIKTLEKENILVIIQQNQLYKISNWLSSNALVLKMISTQERLFGISKMFSINYAENSAKNISLTKNFVSSVIMQSVREEIARYIEIFIGIIKIAIEKTFSIKISRAINVQAIGKISLARNIKLVLGKVIFFQLNKYLPKASWWQRVKRNLIAIFR